MTQDARALHLLLQLLQQHDKAEGKKGVSKTRHKFSRGNEQVEGGVACRVGSSVPPAPPVAAMTRPLPAPDRR